MNNKYLNHSNPSLNYLQNYNEPVIGLDLDSVVASTRKRFLEEIEKRYNITINKNFYGTDPYIPHVDKSYGELVQEIVSDNIAIYDDIDPISGASEATQKLKDNFKIKIITHRVEKTWLDETKRENMKNISIKWLNQNDIHYDEFIYPTPKDKSNVPA